MSKKDKLKIKRISVEKVMELVFSCEIEMRNSRCTTIGYTSLTNKINKHFRGEA